MNDKKSVLEQLSIPDHARGGHPNGQHSPAHVRKLVAGAALLAAAIVAFGAYEMAQDGGSNASAIPIGSMIIGQSLAAGAKSDTMLEASGYVVPRLQATLSTKIAGKIEALYIEEGEHVAAGQILARLDDSNTRAALAVAKARVEAARLVYRDAVPIYRRAEMIFRKGISSQQAYDEAKATLDAAASTAKEADSALVVAQRNQDDTVLHAPFAGIVVDKTANVGEIVSPNSAGSGYTRTGICTIVDMKSLEVDVDVNERFISRVRHGQAVTINLDAYPDWRIPGSVIAVVPTADRSKGTVRVRVGFKSLDPRILPEMSASVQFRALAAKTDAQAGGGLYLPADAVVISGDHGTVYLIAGNHVEARVVRGVRKTSQGIAIGSGLSSGDRIAVGDLSKLRDGQKVTLIN